MGINKTTIRELIDATGVPRSIRMSRLRAAIDQAKWKLPDLLQELAEKKSEEILVIQKMNTFRRLKEIEQYYPADIHMLNDSKGLPPNDSMPLDPDARINWVRNRLISGIESFEAERSRIQNSILKINREIMLLRHNLVQAQEELVEKSDISMDKEKIAKQIHHQVYILYEIHRSYLFMTSDENGKRRCNSTDAAIKKVEELAVRFESTAKRNPFVQKGTLILDYKDPGSEANELALLNLMNRCYNVLGNQTGAKLNDETLNKYSDLMKSHTADIAIAENVTQDEREVPEPSDALSVSTKTVAKGVTWINNSLVPAVKKGLASLNKINSYWDKTTWFEAQKTAFDNKVMRLNQGMPLCVPPPQTPGDKEKTSTEKAQNQSETDAGAGFKKEFAETKREIPFSTIQAQIDNLLNNLTGSVNEKSGTAVPSTGTDTFKLEGTQYLRGANLYQVRILRNAISLRSYLLDMKTNGYLDDSTYLFYYNIIIAEINRASPAFFVYDSTYDSTF